MSALDDLIAVVGEVKSVVAEAIDKVKAFASQIVAAHQNNDSEAVEKLVDDLHALAEETKSALAALPHTDAPAAPQTQPSVS